MPHSATHVLRHWCRSADVRHCGLEGALCWLHSQDARAASLLHLRRRVVAWACDGLHSSLALDAVVSRLLGTAVREHTPGNSHSSARPLSLHLSHGGRSSWMHFCLADRQETHATGFRIIGYRDDSDTADIGEGNTATMPLVAPSASICSLNPVPAMPLAR